MVIQNTDTTWNPEHFKTALSGEKNLEGFNLKGAAFWNANLQGANLQETSLQGANLQGAQLQGVKLRGAKLRGAKLRGAQLQGGDLIGVDLVATIFSGTDVLGACFDKADLSMAIFSDVLNLSPGQLIKAKNVHLVVDLPFSLQEVILAKQLAAMEDDS